MRSDSASYAGETLEFPRQHQFRHGSFIERHFGIITTIHQMPIYLLNVDPLTSLTEPGDDLIDQNWMTGCYVMKKNGSHHTPFMTEKISS
jgi:hypothetical protein